MNDLDARLANLLGLTDALPAFSRDGNGMLALVEALRRAGAELNCQWWPEEYNTGEKFTALIAFGLQLDADLDSPCSVRDGAAADAPRLLAEAALEALEGREAAR